MSSSEQIDKRRRNQYTILRALHFEGPMRRGQIGNRYGIRKSSITSIVSELLECGVVVAERPGSSRSSIRLDRSDFHALVADVTPRSLVLARVYLDGRIADRREVPYAGGNEPAAVIPLLDDCLAGMLNDGCGTPLGVGVAVPGLVDPAGGRCLHMVNLSGWRDVPLGHALSERLGHPVLIDNDVRCQLWACTWFDRLARDTDNVVYLNVHDGVACAIMMHGRRIIGERFAAGEIGHIRVGDEGRVCTCGKTDCLEAYCSIPAILEELRQLRPQLGLTTPEDVVSAAAEDVVVVNVLDRVTQRLARSLAGLVAALDPHSLVLGTADRALSAQLRPLLQRHLYTELIGLTACDADIVIADAVPTTTIKGIAGLVIDDSFRAGRLTL